MRSRGLSLDRVDPGSFVVVFWLKTRNESFGGKREMITDLRTKLVDKGEKNTVTTEAIGREMLKALRICHL